MFNESNPTFLNINSDQVNSLVLGNRTITGTVNKSMSPIKYDPSRRKHCTVSKLYSKGVVY
jgi:hypothetical protein